jgi:hypothetical protein
MKKCDDCECDSVCARWVAGNVTAEPATPDAARDLVMDAIVARAGGPRREDWAGDRNDYARPFPEAPWVWRALPVESSAWAGDSRPGMVTADLGHESTYHDFATPDVSRNVRQRRLVSCMGARPDPE